MCNAKYQCKCTLCVCVLSGQDDYDRLRPLSYQDANLILVCYDVTNPTSYENVLIKVYLHTNVLLFVKNDMFSKCYTISFKWIELNFSPVSKPVKCCKCLDRKFCSLILYIHV